MNANDPFVMVARTEKVVAKPQQSNIELEMLRNFYDAWEALHAITGDKRNPEIRTKYEQAAQALVDAAQPLRILRKQHG